MSPSGGAASSLTRSRCAVFLFRLHLRDSTDTGQFSIIDVRPLHGMNDLCQRYGFKILAYGVLVSINFTCTRSLHLDVDVGSSAAGF